jgi:two-component system, chemotaxis family, CheB/CheR fusion protein
VTLDEASPEDGPGAEVSPVSAGASDPSRDPGEDFPIVGIGASAGGLAALEAFFSGMPVDRDPGMAFVLVQHLAPDHESVLSDLIARQTRMRVFQVEDGMPVEPNCVYVIPPNRDMSLSKGRLYLTEPDAPRGQRLPIDFFFRSLARDQKARAMCVVLSGTGSDGTLGLRMIKGEGGMAMVQSPETTEYSGMPRSAIGTGLVDFVLPPSEMLATVIAYAGDVLEGVSRSDRPGTPPSELPPGSPDTLELLFAEIRDRTGHDFSDYKRSTVHRRLKRRMAVQRVDRLDDYVKFLKSSPQEVEALFRDLLIGVTRFFRDPEAFQALSDALSEMIAEKPPGSVIRVWVPGCSTGEEAYSVAILLRQQMEAMDLGLRVKVFATDIDPRAIEVARAGVYPSSIAPDLPDRGLTRFFVPTETDETAYRIREDIREMLVFSEQNVVQDPPFSRLDLITCRNLLIYLNQDLQKQLIPLFHYALNPGGLLFLGTAESVGDFTDLFVPVDRRMSL